MAEAQLRRNCRLCKQAIQYSTLTAFLVFNVILTILSFVLFSSCVEQKMSLKEAKQVAVSMSDRSFSPPPRSIYDIMTVLEDTGEPDEQSILAVNEIKARATALPPESTSKISLAEFYRIKAMANFDLGLRMKGLQDFRKAYRLMKESGTFDPIIEGVYGNFEAWFGNINKGIEVLEKHVKRPEAEAMAFVALQTGYIESGNIKAAEKIKFKGIAFINKRKVLSPYLLFCKALMEYRSLEVQGKYEEAEPHIRKLIALTKNYQIFPNFQTQRFYDRYYLVKNLIEQHRFVEAELEAREGIKTAMTIGGNSSTATALLIGALSEIYIRQGRLEDAKKLCEANIQIWQKLDFPTDSWWLAKARIQLSIALAAQGNFLSAIDQLTLAEEGLTNNKISFTERVKRDPQVILSQLMTGRVDIALNAADNTYELFRDYLGDSNYHTAEMLALRGMANTRKGNIGQAIADFIKAIPIILNNNQKRSSYLSSQRLKYILDDYIEALGMVSDSPLEKKLEIDASEEAFKLVEAGIGNTVKSALGASSARAAASDPELSDLVRKEQDALKQINALQVTLTNALSLPTDEQNPEALKDLKTTIDTLSKARIALLKEIKNRFPRYSDYIDPKPAKFATVQKHLLPDEAMIVIYPTAEQLYVWAIPFDGNKSFAIVQLGKKDLANIILRLRKTLAPQPKTFEDIPEFDLASAYELYANMLKPVESGWQGAKNLIIIAAGDLAQLPFSVLPVASVTLGNERGVLFANYRNIPWLIRKVSITRLPSVSSFITLRSIPEGEPNRKPFAGFGDPFFNKKQMAQAVNKSNETFLSNSKVEGQLKVRGIRITGEGNLDSEQIWSSQLGKLNRLPDTADEIKSIARAMGVDAEQDVFLGKRASEHRVKTMNLLDRRVIAFASHGLVPGDLDGLEQPAIALSAPSVTGDNEDGLLTMGEILKLKLNADWVVLSACNTGAAEGAGAEAVSGLGRAFFYAGSRALLVSMWPIETTSAKKITTGLFRFQKENPELSRATGLKKSILHLIEKQVIKDESSGKIVASYAHPFFWAPFIVVGDGR